MLDLMRRLSVICILIGFAIVNGSHGEESSIASDKYVFRDTPGYFFRAVNALEKLIGYLEDHYKEGNLDLFIGTRIAEGQLHTLLNSVKTVPVDSKILSEDVVQRISDMLRQIRSVGDRGTAMVKVNQPDYYDLVGGMTDTPVWRIEYSEIKRINKTLFTESLGRESIKEPESDACAHEMMKPSKAQCKVSDGCWELITAPNFYGYSLSHQLLLLEIGAKVGCLGEFKRLAKRSGSTVNHLADRICANMFQQAEEIAKADFPHGKRDIFMEQIALCGILGYSEFFQAAWLDRIISWQKAQGCYTYHTQNFIRPPDELVARSRSHRITKREEKKMKDGCSSHRTAVAAAALGAHVKFLALLNSL